MDAERRLVALVNKLRTEGRVDVAQAAREHGAAEMTIRRDLEVLVSRRVARRVRGGAVSLLARGDEVPYWTRELEAGSAKARIGRAVAELVRDGDAIGLDSGTTALEVARALHDRRLTVLAVSLQAAVALGEYPSVRLIVPGGDVRPGELAMTGDRAVSAISALRFDAVIVAACGLGDATVTAYDLGDAAVKRALIQSSARVIVVADSSKFARIAMAVVRRTDEVDVLVTDTDAPPAAVSALRDAGVEVLCV